MKKILIVLAAAVLVTAAFHSAEAQKQAPAGFRGVIWGADLEDTTDMEPWEKDPTMNTSQLHCCSKYERCYTRLTDKMSAGDAPLKNIIYCSTNGKFDTVLVTYPSSSYQEIKEILDYKYGTGLMGDGSGQACTSNCFWNWENIEMKLNKGMNTLIYVNTGIQTVEQAKIKEIFEQKLDDL